jgi:hypothetical protein
MRLFYARWTQVFRRQTMLVNRQQPSPSGERVTRVKVVWLVNSPKPGDKRLMLGGEPTNWEIQAKNADLTT